MNLGNCFDEEIIEKLSFRVSGKQNYLFVVSSHPNFLSRESFFVGKFFDEL